MTPKRVFISYAWEDASYRQWVERLAVRLRDDGVDARIDAWHLEADDSIPDFMNREVRHADWVLVLCSPLYRAKVHATEDRERITGSGWEARLISGALFSGHQRKVLAALARGSWSDSAPDFLSGQIYADLSAPEGFEAGYADLLRRITDSGRKAPPLGPQRTNLQPEPVSPLRAEDGRWTDGGEASAAAAPEADPDTELRFELREADDGSWAVELRVGDGEPTVAPFRLDLDATTGQTATELKAVAANSCSGDDIQNLGGELWSRLLAGAIETEFDRARRSCRQRPDAVLKVRLVLPPRLEDLPWEALLDLDEGSLATSPNVSVVRTPQDLEESPPPPPAEQVADRLRILVVIPSGSSLVTSSEWEKIRLSARAAGEWVTLQPLDGRVTRDRLAEALQEHWDIVHFIGHGRLDEQGRVELRFNPEEGATDDTGWMSARLFAQQFRRCRTRLVVLNCCHGASLDPQGLSGLGLYLAKTRVHAVLAMRYAIGDSVAADFSSAFYRELLLGRRPGRVDLAVQEGRAALERNHSHGDRVRSYITPVLYLAPGCERLFLPPSAEPEPATETERGREQVVVDERIDRRLVTAVAGRFCLPILGPGILAAGAQRDDVEPPPSLGTLARQLAESSGFPEVERIAPLADTGADWLTPAFFRRVCQHFESVADEERRSLNQAIQSAYSACQPSEFLRQIAGWHVPAAVYTHVDGLLEHSLETVQSSRLRVVQAEDLDRGASPARDELVLVNLRGSYVAPSMVLTEADEDRVLDRMDRISTFVVDLMNRVGGCTLLFLGVSLHDPLVRALARHLLREDVARNRGTAFFAGGSMSRADRSYWQQFPKLEWLELDAESLIASLSAVAARGEAGR